MSGCDFIITINTLGYYNITTLKFKAYLQIASSYLSDANIFGKIIGILFQIWPVLMQYVVCFNFMLMLDAHICNMHSIHLIRIRGNWLLLEIF